MFLLLWTNLGNIYNNNSTQSIYDKVYRQEGNSPEY